MCHMRSHLDWRVLPLLFIAIIVGLVGCMVQSIQPLFASKEYVAYPELPGVWAQMNDGKEIGTWTIKEDKNVYRLEQVDEDKRRGLFVITAGRIGQETFLNIMPEDPLPGGKLNHLMTVHLIPANLFIKPIKTNDVLHLVLMDLEWLAKHLKENPKAIAHIWRNDGDATYPILIAPSADLQKFVGLHSQDTNVFKNVITLTKKRN